MTDRLPWFRCFPDRLLAALAEMDADTQHVYVTVLLKIYARGGPVRNDPKALATFCRRPVRAVTAALERLTEMGRLTLVEGELSNPVAEEELAHRGEVSHSRAKNGKLGGKKAATSRAAKSQQNQQPAVAIATNGEAKSKPGSSNKIEIREEREEPASAASSARAQPLDNEPMAVRKEIVRVWTELASTPPPDTGRATVWLAKGYRREIIIAVLREVLARKPTLSTLAYFDGPIADAHATPAPHREASHVPSINRSVQDVAREIADRLRGDGNPAKMLAFRGG